MADGRLRVSETGALRCILYCLVDRKSIFLVALSFYCLLSVAGIAADVQVNPPDHNARNQDNFTTQNEPTLAVAGSLVVVGYNSTKRMGNPVQFRVSQYAVSTDGGATFKDGGFVPAPANGALGVIPPSPAARTARRCIMHRSARTRESRAFSSIPRRPSVR